MNGDSLKKDADKRICPVCFAHCALAEGQSGRCHARMRRGGEIVPVNYGLVTSIALDPIEKKPLRRFFPGSRILSVGSFGCNLRCPFCQNYEIACAQPDAEAPGRVFFTKPDGDGKRYEIDTRFIAPETLCALAGQYAPQGNLGVAFTYNEPLVGFEYVRDTARLVRAAGMKNVLVTNGTAALPVLEELLPDIDAMNIDLKGFQASYYRDLLHGDLEMTKAFIARAAEGCHVELTTLIVPGCNDSEAEMRELTGWIAALNGGRGRDIPLHITRFFPRYRLRDRAATDAGWIYHLADIARERLQYVYEGNC